MLTFFLAENLEIVHKKTICHEIVSQLHVFTQKPYKTIQ